MSTPWLTDDEIDDLCGGLVQNHAKVRFLRGLGLFVRQKPNGRPLVNRSHYDAVMGCCTDERGHSINEPVWGVH